LQTEWDGLILWGAAALVIAPIVIAGAGWLLQRAGLRRDARRYPPTGLLLSRGDRDLHLVQRGNRQPAVIFEAGLAASSLSWARVQPLVAAFASSVSYDRAGLGWSSPRTSPPFLKEMLEDLRCVVVRAADGNPVVLVAHSFGALLLLAFTQHYPNLVAGLVLVDPVSLATWSDCSAVDRHRLQVGAQLSRRGGWLAKFGVVRAALEILLRGGQPFARLIGRRAAGRAATTLERLTGEVSKLPRELWPLVAAHWSRPHNFRAMADTLEALPAYAAEASSPHLPAELPVAILSAASATEGELRERNGWLMGLLHTEHKILQETGHWLHLERPEEVAAAVRWCVERSRVHA
jgi:pimeloyl-ACP methyl ester carboxylesterase